MVDFVPTAEVEAWIQRVNFQTPRVHVSNPEYHKGGMLSKGYLDFDFTTTLPNGESYSSRHRFSEIEVRFSYFSFFPNAFFSEHD